MLLPKRHVFYWDYSDFLTQKKLTIQILEQENRIGSLQMQSLE